MAEELPSVLTLISVDVRKAIDGGLCFAAIATALTIPAVCSALEKTDGRSNGIDYRAWYNAHVAGSFENFFTADDCYSLRCGIIHQGHPVVLGGVPRRVVFRVPGQSGNIHNNAIETGGEMFVQFEIDLFCNTFLDAMKEWYEARKYDEIVLANLQKAIKYYSNIGGLPIQIGAALA